jgi:lipopolysaccharide export system permease protein
MTIAARRGPTNTFVVVRRGIRLAPSGWYTRYMFRNYLRHTLIMVAALLSIALTTDLSVWIWRLITGNPNASWLWLSYRIGRIVVLRGTDLLALAAPISCFLGVLWTEVLHTWSRERLTIWNLGRSPVQCIVPVLLFAATMGSLQFALDAYLRPAAVMALENRPDEMNPDFNFSPDKHWIAAGDALVHARISPGPPPSLGELAIYQLAKDGALLAVITAEKATPGRDPGTWSLQNGRVWTVAAHPARTETPPSASQGRTASERTFEQMDLVLPIEPLWLSRYGIHPQYIPNAILRQLAAPSWGSHSTRQYRVWYDVRYADAFLPGGMALLATSLSLLLIAYRVRLMTVFAIASAGYAAHVSEKVFLVLGEYGELPSAISAWIVPLLLVTISATVLVVLTIRSSNAKRKTPHSDEHSVSVAT